MFQGALGRLGSRIQAPSESLTLRVFADAGGRAAEHRVWGGIAMIGDVESAWLDTTMLELRAEHAQLCMPTGELKGAALPDAEIRRVGRRMRDEDRRILFWANWYPSVDDQRMAALATKAIDFLKTLRADRFRFDAQQINARYDRMAIFLEDLKGINRHKVVCTLAHLGWLMEELRLRSLGGQLGSVKVVLDREDIPLRRDCAEILRLFLVASLQAVGMSARITWRALGQEPDVGAITIDPDGESADHPGLQFVDILLQGVQRGLPGYGGRRKADKANISGGKP